RHNFHTGQALTVLSPSRTKFRLWANQNESEVVHESVWVTPSVELSLGLVPLGRLVKLRSPLREACVSFDFASAFLIISSDDAGREKNGQQSGGWRQRVRLQTSRDLYRRNRSAFRAREKALTAQLHRGEEKED